MPDDEKINELIRQHAAAYRADPPAPADALWRRMERDVAAAIAPKRRVWLFAGAAVAAALLVGIAVGRWTTPSVQSVATRDDSLHHVAYLRAAAVDHLGDTEIFLTEVRADLRAGRSDTDRAARSRELLARTRLLLQNPAQQSPAITRLLEDLELLLAEIAALPDSGPRRPADAALLEETLRRNDILPRIRTTVPARGT